VSINQEEGESAKPVSTSDSPVTADSTAGVVTQTPQSYIKPAILRLHAESSWTILILVFALIISNKTMFTDHKQNTLIRLSVDTEYFISYILQHVPALTESS
jgi:hypothetical protein